MALKLRKFSENLDLSDFYCGVESIDKFIHSNFLRVISNFAGYYLWNEDTKEIVAFFVLDLDKVEVLNEDTADDIKLVYDYELVGMQQYHSTELMYLAVKKEYRNQGIGSLCIDEILRIAREAANVGVRFVTVDAYHTNGYSAIPFYEKNKFICVEYPNPNSDTLRMLRVIE